MNTIIFLCWDWKQQTLQKMYILSGSSVVFIKWLYINLTIVSICQAIMSP